MTDYKFKEGDVYRWSYNDVMLKKKSDGNNGGTTYWCCARIAICFTDGSITDTYWHGGSSSNKWWTEEEAVNQLELTFLGNLNDYEIGSKYDRVYYSDDDCLDLSHPNHTRGDFYIKKDAVRDTDKMKRILKRNITKVSREIEYQLRSLEKWKNELKDFDVDMYLMAHDGVSVDDHSYLDDQEDNQ
jgi:hypothetical protein